MVRKGVSGQYQGHCLQTESPFSRSKDPPVLLPDRQGLGAKNPQQGENVSLLPQGLPQTGEPESRGLYILQALNPGLVA